MSTSIAARYKLDLGILRWTTALLWLIVAFAPFAFMIIMGFKSSDEVIMNPVYSLPGEWRWNNFLTVLKGSFARGLMNSLIVCSVSILIILGLSSMAAYAFSRLRFRFSGPLFALVVAGLIVPIHSTLIPIYLLIKKIGLYNTLPGLILPYVAFGLPVSIFILTGFMREIPRDMGEAAKVDGCGDVRAFWQIYLPLTRSGLVTVGIFNAVSLWNEFVFAYVLTSSTAKRTLPLTIWDYQGQYSSDTAMIMAALTLSAVPLVLAYLVFQDKLVNGIMAGAIRA